MKAIRIAFIFAVFAAISWLIAVNPSGRAEGPVLDGWQASLVSMGLALGMASINAWKLHERIGRPGLHLAFGLIMLGVGISGILLTAFGTPAHVLAPFAVMFGLAWAMVGGAGVRLHRA